MKYEFKGNCIGGWRVIPSSSGEWIESSIMRGDDEGDIVCRYPKASAPKSIQNWHDNKHLICAAPELLKACIMAFETLGAQTDMKLLPVYESLKYAIHKALNISTTLDHSHIVNPEN